MHQVLATQRGPTTVGGQFAVSLCSLGSFPTRPQKIEHGGLGGLRNAPFQGPFQRPARELPCSSVHTSLRMGEMLEFFGLVVENEGKDSSS
eukprot:gene25981-biopygen12530